MSLYNMVNGVNPATFYILPMLGKHPDEYPRFRDCFMVEELIHILTRTGGSNRSEYVEENQAIRDMPGFVTDFDDARDSTYAHWVFTMPEEYKETYRSLQKGVTPPEYIEQLEKVYPKLKGKFQ